MSAAGYEISPCCESLLYMLTVFIRVVAMIITIIRMMLAIRQSVQKGDPGLTW